MKSIIFCSTLAALVAFSFAAESNAVAESLIHRGEELILLTNHLLKEHRNHSLDHLVETIEHEVALVEALVFELKWDLNKVNSTVSLHHLHTIEEDLLYMEHRISDELAVLEDTLKHEHLGQSVEQLIAHANALIEHAKQVAKNYGNSHNQKEIHSIEHEISLLQKLIHALEKHPTGEELHREEQTLVRNQQTLLHLIERVIAHSEHHQDPKHPTAAPHHEQTTAAQP